MVSSTFFGPERSTKICPALSHAFPTKVLPRTGKWIHRHRMILTIHDPIPPKGQGADNMKATMAEAYSECFEQWALKR